MNIPELIERKREGGQNSPDELRALLEGLVAGTVPRYQVSAWLMAVLFRGMDRAETAALTRLMMESGDILDLAGLPGVKVDKHSTGGVGDKISIPLAPAVAAAGAVIPMISGRGLGHTGGTLDKLESIPGLRTDLSAEVFRRVVAEVGFSIVSASERLAPADRALYALRDVTGTVPSIPLITASILSKKYAAGVDGLVLDVKCGSGAFMRERKDAEELARVLVDVSEAMGKKAVAVLTSMDQPLGSAVGNALEIAESLDVLRGTGPADVRELVLALGAEMLCLSEAGLAAPAARDRIAETLANGQAMDRFRRFVEAQGGDPAVCDDAGRLPRAPVVTRVMFSRSGVVAGFDTREIGLAANALGAGRTRVGDEVDPAVGFLFQARIGDAVNAGDCLAEVHARTEDGAAEAARRILQAVRVTDETTAPAPVILGAPAV